MQKVIAYLPFFLGGIAFGILLRQLRKLTDRSQLQIVRERDAYHDSLDEMTKISIAINGQLSKTEGNLRVANWRIDSYCKQITQMNKVIARNKRQIKALRATQKAREHDETINFLKGDQSQPITDNVPSTKRTQAQSNH